MSVSLPLTGIASVPRALPDGSDVFMMLFLLQHPVPLSARSLVKYIMRRLSRTFAVTMYLFINSYGGISVVVT